jgi:hypothetical protein
MEPISFQTHPGIREYREGALAFSPTTVLYATVGAVGGIGLAAYEAMHAPNATLSGVVIAATAGLGIYFFSVVSTYLVNNPLRAARNYAGEVVYTFSNDRVYWSRGNATGERPLNSWTGWKETKRTLVLRARWQEVTVIKKSDVPTERLDDLRSLFQRTLGRQSTVRLR